MYKPGQACVPLQALAALPCPGCLPIALPRQQVQLPGPSSSYPLILLKVHWTLVTVQLCIGLPESLELSCSEPKCGADVITSDSPNIEDSK